MTRRDEKRRTSLERFYDLYDRDQWKPAERVLLRLLKDEPRSHWLLTRLSSVVYEQKRYKEALKHANAALRVMPSCPLARWDRAGALEMTGRVREAIEVWKSLVRRGTNGLAKNPCSEGPEWARSLVNDCRFQIGISYHHLRAPKSALRWMRQYLKARRAGVGSVYSVRDARVMLANFERARVRDSHSGRGPGG